MYEESAIEILDPYLTAHEEAHIEDFFRTKKSSACTWTSTRRDWAFRFFGVATFKRMCNFLYFYRDGTTVWEDFSRFRGYVKGGSFTSGCSPFQKCCGMSEVTVELIDGMAVANKQKTLDLSKLIPIWKERILVALVARKAGVIATINEEQKPLIPALKELGFESKSDWMYNPNSGNNIMLLFFQFPE